MSKSTAATHEQHHRARQPVWQQLKLEDDQVHPAICKLQHDFRDTPSKPLFRLRRADFYNPDLERFRNLTLYEQRHNSPKANKNLLFHQNKIPSKPLGAKIETIHKVWAQDFDKLEKHHGYIQWLFPIHERGMTFESQILQVHEREAIKKDRRAMHRFLESYKMMLRFYGFRLTNERTGEIAVLSKAVKRHSNLNAHSHNYLRITRILKCLGLFGLPHYQSGFMAGMLRAMLLHNVLANARSSCGDYWVNAVLRDVDRKALQDIIVEWSAKPASRTASDAQPLDVGSSGDDDDDADDEDDDDKDDGSDGDEDLSKYDVLALGGDDAEQQDSTHLAAQRSDGALPASEDAGKDNEDQEEQEQEQEQDGEGEKTIEGAEEGETMEENENEDKDEENCGQIKAADTDTRERSPRTVAGEHGAGIVSNSNSNSNSNSSSSRSSGDSGSGSGANDFASDGDGHVRAKPVADSREQEATRGKAEEVAGGNCPRVDTSPCSKQPKITRFFMMNRRRREPAPLETGCAGAKAATNPADDHASSHPPGKGEEATQQGHDAPAEQKGKQSHQPGASAGEDSDGGEQAQAMTCRL